MFSLIAITGGIGACVAGTITGDTVPIVLGVISAVCGMVLVAFAFLAHRKIHS